MGVFAADWEEQWKDVVGWEDRYEVSNFGNVKSKSYLKHTANMHGPMSFMTRPKVMSQVVNPGGYLAIDLRKNKTRATGLIHRLVATAFLENPDNLPIVNPKDSDRTNNRYSNLEWCTQQHNVQHSYDSGSNSNKGDDHPCHIFTEAIARKIRVMHAEGWGVQALADLYGMRYDTTKAALTGKNWGHVV